MTARKHKIRDAKGRFVRIPSKDFAFVVIEEPVINRQRFWFRVIWAIIVVVAIILINIPYK